MDIGDIYKELKDWQSGIGALLGFLALVFAAFLAYILHRRRDRLLQSEEVKSIAMALYSEVTLLREEIAFLIKYLSNAETSDSIPTEDIIARILPSEPKIYSALASKIGMLPSDQLSCISRFYADVERTRRGVEQLLRSFLTREEKYAPLIYLDPGLAAIDEVTPFLRDVEAEMNLSEAVRPDTGHGDGLHEEWHCRIEQEG